MSSAITCTKKKFTEKRARDVVVQAKIKLALHNNLRRLEDGCYRCDDCKSWHVTSHGQSATLAPRKKKKTPQVVGNKQNAVRRSQRH